MRISTLSLRLSLALLGSTVLAEPIPQQPLQTTANDADPSYRTLSTASNPNWMGAIPDATSLAALSIPGTHESLAIFGGDIAECHENFGASANTLTAQLNAGIRVFDIRLRIETGNTFVVHHGAIYQNANFDDVLAKLGTFLAAHPTEALLLRVKQECTGQFGSCTDVSGQLPFTNIFDLYAAKPAANFFWDASIDRNSAAEVPTLGAVRGKAVLMVINGPHGGRTDAYGLAQFAGWNDGDSTYVQDNYDVPDIGAIATKRDQVRRFLDALNVGDESALYVNFCSGASLLAFPYQVAAGTLGVQGVNPFLLTYLNQGTDVHAPVHRTGITMMDFPGGGLIDKILSFNN
ncbi:1-phosphatidylinositol phosphodiesterase [Mycena pura]|uniref:1-phosphatidylinositol phosphodiesterase n=1 Tax=Mycena pura TaxID=153505 RepID=A0AAD6VJJ5_9AGAR|nr:1-phosphatidylinositol phosphodiesterase [Mycena pura]